MYELLLAVCINGDPAQCMERRLPLGEDMNMMRCMREGLVHAQKWADAHPDLELKKWRCVEPEEAAAGPVGAYSVTEVADGVYVHRGQHAIPSAENLNDTSNTGFIIGGNAVAVVDAGGSAVMAEALLAEIREVTDKPVKYLILTHMHPDHVLGAQVFKDAGATVIGHKKLDRALKARARTYEDNLKRLIGDAGYAGSAIVVPDEGVTGSREIDLGGRLLVLEAHPTAHTDNDLTVLDKQTGTLFLGDLLFAEHTPALDGSILGWLKVVEGLKTRAVSGVVPGHGPVLLDWPDGSLPMVAYLEALVGSLRTSIAKGETMSKAIRTVGDEHRENWVLFDEFHPRNVTAAFKELEWE